MTGVTAWWWVRHAPVIGANGRLYGRRDLEADCNDGATFRWLAETLPRQAVWITSNLSRTHQTAAAILEASGEAAPPAIAEPDLAEQHFGDWQGLTYDEVLRRDEGAGHRFWLAPASVTPPGGESFTEVVERVGAAVDRLSTAHAGRDVIAVAHGGTIRAALCQALGLAPEGALAFSVANCSLTRLERISGTDGGTAWRVVCVNVLPGRD